MTKAEFLERLSRELKGVPSAEREKTLLFYSEMIDDRMDDGMTEEAAAASLGDPADIAAGIREEMPLYTKMRAKAGRGESHRALWIVLIVLGFPVWFVLLAVAAVVALVVFICIWVVDASLWCAVAGLAGGFVGGVGGAIVMLFAPHLGNYMALSLGAGLVSAGVGVAVFLGVLWLTKKLGIFSGWLFKRVGRLFRFHKGGRKNEENG